MKLTCKYNNYTELSDQRQLAIATYLRGEYGRTYLRPGKDYLIVGIIFRDNVPWIYVFEDTSESYPKPFPIDYFDPQDFLIPSDWILKSRVMPSGKSTTEILPTAWASFDRFYEMLLDDDPEALNVMAAIRQSCM